MIKKSLTLVVFVFFVFTLIIFLKNPESVVAICQDGPPQCIDTYQNNGAETYGPSSCASFNTCTTTKTVHWKVYFLDGYDRTIDPSENGEVYSNPVGSWYCHPQFDNPTFNDNPGGVCSTLEDGPN